MLNQSINQKFQGSCDLSHALWGKLFVRLLGIRNTKLLAKFEIFSSNSFEDAGLFARNVRGHGT